jgi:hypothetical protein
MRVFSMALIAFAALTQAQAYAQENAPPAIAPLQPPRAVAPLNQPAPGPANKTDAPCSYSINGYPYEVPNGKSLCWRSPFPYGAVYALLQCGPPIQEITQVKRGDARCDRYEMRQ